MIGMTSGEVRYSNIRVDKILVRINKKSINHFLNKVLNFPTIAGRTFEVFKSKLLLGRVGLVEFEMTNLLNMLETFILFYFFIFNSA